MSKTIKVKASTRNGKRVKAYTRTIKGGKGTGGLLVGKKKPKNGSPSGYVMGKKTANQMYKLYAEKYAENTGSTYKGVRDGKHVFLDENDGGMTFLTSKQLVTNKNTHKN